MPKALSNTQSRWYKKQVLARSDKALKASLEAQGHSFAPKRSHLQEQVAAALRHASIRVGEVSTDGGVKVAYSLTANRAVLRKVGFLDMGGGFMKYGHSTWRLEADQEGDVTVHRLEEESVKAASFAARRAGKTAMSDSLTTLGYPLAVQETLALGEKMYAQSHKVAYPCPDRILVGGLRARVAGYTDRHFLVAFDDTGIVTYQPITSCLDRDANSRVAALQESAQSLIAHGEYTRAARTRIAEELAADETLEREDVDSFIASLDAAVRASIVARCSNPSSSLAHTASKEASLESDVASGFVENHGSESQGASREELTGIVQNLGLSGAWGDEVQDRFGWDMEFLDSCVDAIMKKMGKTAQSADAVVVLPVAGGAYPDGHMDSTLTHACVIGADGAVESVLCGNVRPASILDDATQATNTPTCSVCARKLQARTAQDHSYTCDECGDVVSETNLLDHWETHEPGLNSDTINILEHFTQKEASKTAQSVQQWTLFNDAWVCDYAPTLHGMIKQESADPDSFRWELFDRGRICDAGGAQSLDEAQMDCGLAASLIESYGMDHSASTT